MSPLEYYNEYIKHRQEPNNVVENIWHANSRVIFNLEFDSLQSREKFDDGYFDGGYKSAVESVSKLTELVAKKHEVDLSQSRILE